MKIQAIIRFIVVMSVVSTLSCKRGGEFYFYVVNGSELTRRNIIKVTYNDSVIINETFEYSNVVPNDKIFKIVLPDPKGVLRVNELAHGTEVADSIDIKKEKYIFISFNEFKTDSSHSDTVRRIINVLKRNKYTSIY